MGRSDTFDVGGQVAFSESGLKNRGERGGRGREGLGRKGMGDKRTDIQSVRQTDGDTDRQKVMHPDVHTGR